MKKCICAWAGVITMALCIATCKKEHAENPSAPGCDTICYNKQVKPIIYTKCAISGCHVPGGSGNGNFTTYSGVKAKVDNGTFEQRVLVRGDMPPGGGLTQSQKDILRKWLDCGAREQCI